MTQRKRPAANPGGSTGDPALDQELERTTQMRGFRYGLHDFVGAVGGAETLKRHNDNTHRNYLKESKIDRKTKELLIVVACMASRDLVSHMQIHMHAAHKAGASPEEIMEVIDLVSGWTGNVAKIPALEAWRATFRPDIPTIDRVVELR
jgi:alkylhydroperoxidase/carboxymuconolactone decarboxylase family protein YurZ